MSQTTVEWEAGLVLAVKHYIVDSGIPEQLMSDGLLGYDDLFEGYQGGPYVQSAGGWVMGADPAGNPFREVQGTGLCAIVTYVADEWTIPSMYHTTQFPRLHVQVWADRSRDADGNPIIPHDAEDKARQVWRALHPLFHDAANVVHSFDTIRVISTLQGGSWSIMEVADADGVVRGDCTYNLHLD